MLSILLCLDLWLMVFLYYEVLLVSGSKVNGTGLGFYILALLNALTCFPTLLERSSNPYFRWIRNQDAGKTGSRPKFGAWSAATICSRSSYVLDLDMLKARLMFPEWPAYSIVVGWFTHSALRKVSPHCRSMVSIDTLQRPNSRLILGQPDE